MNTENPRISQDEQPYMENKKRSKTEEVWVCTTMSNK